MEKRSESALLPEKKQAPKWSEVSASRKALFFFGKEGISQKKKKNLKQYGGVNDRANYNVNRGWIRARKSAHRMLLLLPVDL